MALIVTKPLNSSGSSLDWKGEWTETTGYMENDLTSNTTSASFFVPFICTSTHTSTLSDEPGIGETWNNYWEYVSMGGELGDIDGGNF
jgi:hypothetical protein